MSLTQHGLGEHFEFPERLHYPDCVELVHELFLGLLKQEVLLVAFRASVVADVPDADAPERILEDVPNSVSETSTVKEGEEEAEDV